MHTVCLRKQDCEYSFEFWTACYLDTLIFHCDAHSNSNIKPEMTFVHMMCAKHLKVTSLDRNIDAIR